ncbi:MAG: HAMP domain-containing histidine kinase [Lachnospiraceae bacterium]|nr:HAMP domain-containing histidine kinase [Lachnospiraceae bacterium]
MTAQIVIGILAVCLVLCLAALIVSTAYFLRQWKKMDRILDNFQQAEADGESQNDLRCSDVSETRESRVISQLTRILNSARYKERQAQEEKKQTMELVSDLSHQFKTPLANIVMDMELLMDCELEEDKRNEFLAHAKSQADKLQWLMADLLKASRLENGIIRFEAENIGIKRTIAQAVSSVYAQAAAKNITLEVEEFEDFVLWHNPKWTAEAMSNILENAVKYSPENSRIQIAAQRLDLYTKITITDEGIGIPESDYNLIFKRFYRGRTVEQQEGSGLGLCLAQLILQCEQGYITVSSKVGRGSSFSMFLLNADEASGK